MKKLILSLIASVMLMGSAKASHVLGGEITWKCLSTGKFIFYMRVYRDCTGIDFPFQNEQLEIFGSPRPRNGNNVQISSITLKPDSARWQQLRNGDTSPSCADNAPDDPYNCASGDPGTVQQFLYQSDPITLSGVPPVTGWRFVWTAPCCRPNVTNLATAGTMILRAEMFPDANNTNTNPCTDSSPEFKALPTNLICRDYEFTYNHTAIDFDDGDSVAYAWDRTYNTPAGNPTPVPYANRFNFNNPTPDATFSALNIPCTLDPVSGIMRVAVYSGGGALDYLTVVRANSYRDGRLIASVYREIPFVFFDCPNLETGKKNKVPLIYIDGQLASGLVTEVTAGDTVRIPFQAIDQDYTGYGVGLQNVTLTPAGFMFSRDLNDPLLCYGSNNFPCAYLENRSPTFNNNISPPGYDLNGLAGLATELVWTPKCKHLNLDGTGVPGTSEGIFNFVMRVQDDHCPIPGINYPTITVKVKDPIPISQPIMKGASVDLDGVLTYSWAPPLDSTSTFARYRSSHTAPNNGQPPSQYQPLDVISNYQQEKRNTGYPIYANNGGQPDILSSRTLLKDMYFRMLTESGCSQDVRSQNSVPVRVMEVNTTPVGPPAYERSVAQLNWNSPKPDNAFSPDHFIYESPTHYYIWQNDSIEQNGTYLGGEGVKGNWFLRGDTSAKTYVVPTTTCNGRIGFRIEARDTVVIPKAGTALRQNKLDTLTFSTFSVIDTMLMKDRGFIPAPRFDTVEVRMNGDIYFRIDRASAGTVDQFKIFEVDPTIPDTTLLTTMSAAVDSFLYAGGSSGNSNVNYFLLQSRNECDSKAKEFSQLYTNHFSDGYFYPCDPNLPGPTFRVALKDPTGFPNGINGYRVYVDKNSNDGSGPYQLIKTINNANQDSVDVPVEQNREHFIKIVAFDDRSDANIGNAYFPDSTFRGKEIVPAPPIYCTYVEDDGSVTLTFKNIGPKTPENVAAGTVDSTGNWTGYEFQYRAVGAPNWQDYANNNTILKDDTSVLISGINAFNQSYEFRARSISGCDGVTPGPWTNIEVKSIFLTAEQEKDSTLVQDTAKVGLLYWNLTGAANVGQYAIFKALEDTVAPFNAARFAGVSSNETFYRDADPRNNEGDCVPTPAYHVKINHISGCINRSNYVEIELKNEETPPVQMVDAVSVNPSTGQVEIYWSEKSGDYQMVNIVERTGVNNFEFRKDSIDWNDRSYAIPLDSLDPFDTTVTLTLQSLDLCNGVNDSLELFDYHTTMDVDVEWVQCDSNNILTWNPYTDFNEGGDDVSYEIYVGEALRGPFSLVPNSTTQDTTYKHKVSVGGRSYYYYVKATNGTNTHSSTSNVDSDSAVFQEEPPYRYLHYATVLPTKEVELSFYKDTLIEQGGYSIYRGLSKEDMRAIGRVDGASSFKDSLITYTDASAATDDYSYFYNVVIENQCGNAIDTSNFGRSIHLTVEPDNEALTNHLRWNEYQEWDSTVAYYNIYRGFNGASATEQYAVVPPTDNGDPNSYIDDVYDNALVIGQFCYRVEAVQGPMTTDFPNKLNSATSSSNEVCVTQKPLFYVPNAFAPDGVNKVFSPKGQFFDFSLYEMVIYNRWGEEIFRTRDINKGWDGTVNGEQAQLGSYVYTIRFVDADGEEHRRKGTVTLIR
ncbi:MAG: gliding motility-associated C-terminal domain-containing protein [Vicingaceae bacterium]